MEILDKLFKNNQIKSTKSSNDFGLVRVATYSPNTKIGDVNNNANQILDCLKDAETKGVHLAVFPELCITGYSLNDMFYQTLLLQEAYNSLIYIKDKSQGIKVLFFVGCPLLKDGRLFNTAVAIFDGEILGVIPKTFIPNYNEFYEKRQFSTPNQELSTIVIGEKEYPFGTNIIFEDKCLKSFTVCCEICEDLWVTNSPSTSHSLNGAILTCNLSASDEILGKDEYRKNLVSIQSAKCVSGYIYANAGRGESSTDVVYSGHSLIAENGKILAQNKPFSYQPLITEIDCDFLLSERTKLFNYNYESKEYLRVYFSLPINNDKILREYPKTPFVPTSKDKLSETINTILSIQAEGLKRRVEHINCKTLVIGVSGGLDSTLALLVAIRALKSLNRNTKDLYAVTMPCFGTTNRTKTNAIKLSNALGCTLLEVDITQSVKQHLKDISRNEDIKDVTYENAQARERTQVLMDIANKTGGIVVGTGDLSELALGWATYNGDHMSMYGVNNSIPKTLVKYMISHIAESSDKDLKETLLDILDTPVSPELIPANNGQITQKTEDIVGPYILHDFFLFYLLRMEFKPSKVFKIATKTFKGEYDKATIYKWLNNFINRFFNQQFKRSCLPDGVKVGTVSLSPRGDLRMPSDMSKTLWLADLESCKNN